jgi:hypothetical protein
MLRLQKGHDSRTACEKKKTDKRKGKRRVHRRGSEVKRKWREKIPTACSLHTALLTEKFQNVSSVK